MLDAEGARKPTSSATSDLFERLPEAVGDRRLGPRAGDFDLVEQPELHRSRFPRRANAELVTRQLKAGVSTVDYIGQVRCKAADGEHRAASDRGIRPRRDASVASRGARSHPQRPQRSCSRATASSPPRSTRSATPPTSRRRRSSIISRPSSISCARSPRVSCTTCSRSSTRRERGRHDRATARALLRAGRDRGRARRPDAARASWWR